MNSLIDKFPFPTPLFLHTSSDSSTDNECNIATGVDQKVSPCCVSSMTCLLASARASAKQSGVGGVLDMLQKKFKWGFKRLNYLCECLQHAGEIDCGASMALALLILNSIELNKDERDLRFAPVQLICGANFVQKAILNEEYLKQFKQQGIGSVPWISTDADCMYHQVVGIISVAKKTILLWDYGEWLLPCNDMSADEAILGLKVVVHDTCKDVFGDSMLYNWGGKSIQLNHWNKIEATTSLDICAEKLAPAVESLQSLLNCAETNNEHSTVECNKTNSVEKECNSKVTVCVSGCHMSANPCSGVGVARAIRIEMKSNVFLVAVDNNKYGYTGMTDFCFDRSLALTDTDHTSASRDVKESDECSNTYAEEKQFKIVLKVLEHFDAENDCQHTFYIPCTDDEVELVAKCMLSYQEPNMNSVVARILSPSKEALAKISKPDIVAGVSYLHMKIPTFMSLTDNHNKPVDISLVYSFCNTHGYPILIKGRKQGMVICYNWMTVMQCKQMCWAKDGFVQRNITGFDKGIAFAAYKGKLLGCVLCSKSVSCEKGKLWCGELEPVSEDVYGAVEQFVKDSNWTGGGEIEFVVDLAGTCWAIDWNPRFPSWIYAATYASCNLPAMLVATAAADVVDTAESASTSVSTSSLTTLTTTSDCFTNEYSVRQQTVQSISFTKTVIEIPRSNYHLHGRNPLVSINNIPETIKGSNRILKLGAMKTEHGRASCELPLLCSQISHLLSNFQASSDDQLWSQNAHWATPRYLLSRQLLVDALERCKQIVNDCATKARSTIFNIEHVFKQQLSFEVQMCLSVKTQPHTVMLQLARKHCYLSECISLAEIRSCLNNGYAPSELVLTGPGKFWDNRASDPMPFICKAAPIKAIFADSLADLNRIIKRVLDPTDWLSCDVIGVRLSPSWVTESRFGIDGKCPKMLLATAELMATLPPHIQIGTHFHHASSHLGATPWFDLAQAFLEITCSFAQLCKRNIAILDFGGGWSSDFIDQPVNQEMLVELLACVKKSLPKMIGGKNNQSKLVVQFELGKCISERAGGLLTRILEIREIDFDDFASNDERRSSEQHVLRRGIILDCSLGDISAVNIYPHPFLWLNPVDQVWHPLSSGNDQLMGRTCMEFEVYGYGVALPAEAKPGDFVLVAHAGAYDMSMHYNFGDGKERDVEVVL